MSVVQGGLIGYFHEKYVAYVYVHLHVILHDMYMAIKVLYGQKIIPES